MPTKEQSIEAILRGLVKKEGLTKVARDLGIDHASLYRSLKDGSNLKLNRIKAILNYFGYGLKISKRKEVKRLPKVGYKPYPTSDYLIKSKSQDRQRR